MKSFGNAMGVVALLCLLPAWQAAVGLQSRWLPTLTVVLTLLASLFGSRWWWALMVVLVAFGCVMGFALSKITSG